MTLRRRTMSSDGCEAQFLQVTLNCIALQMHSISSFAQRKLVINLTDLSWGREQLEFIRKFSEKKCWAAFVKRLNKRYSQHSGHQKHCDCCWPSALSLLTKFAGGEKRMPVINLIDLVTWSELFRITLLFLCNLHKFVAPDLQTSTI